MLQAAPLHLSPLAVREINGVSLFTRTGKPKSRYSDDERLRILGVPAEYLDTFLEIFAPRSPYYAFARAGEPRSWTTPKNDRGHPVRLRNNLVVRHLLGDRLPGKPPIWVAPRAWEATLWVGIDVDFRGDREDFQGRSGIVREALTALGVPKVARLVSRTPSGGLHFRFFLTRAIPTDDIPRVLAMVGLNHVPGQIEIFPSMQRGLRLPFGHVPGQHSQIERFAKFIKRWRAGRFPRVCWVECLRRAEAFERRKLKRLRTGDEDGSPSTPASSRNGLMAPSSRTLGVPKRGRTQEKQPAGTPRPICADSYEALLAADWTDASQANELLQLGIQLPGTRVQATKRLAWHFVHVRRLSVDDATQVLVEWVYRTGETTSKDVQKDRSCGTQHVQVQTRRIVEWCARHKTTSEAPIKRFSLDEITQLMKSAGERTSKANRHRSEFGLRLLAFAKSQGIPTAGGWEIQLSINGIVRKWPRCSGMRYLPFMKWAIQSGLLTLAKEKRQSSNKSGRPRTYLLKVATGHEDNATLTFEQALDIVCQLPRDTANEVRMATPRPQKSDTYLDVSHHPRIHEGIISGEEAEAQKDSVTEEPEVTEKTESTDMNNVIETAPIHVEITGHCHDTRNAISMRPAACPAEPAGAGTAHQPQHQHPQSSLRGLETGTAVCPGVGDAVPGLPAPHPGRMPAGHTQEVKPSIRSNSKCTQPRCHRRGRCHCRSTHPGISFHEFIQIEGERLNFRAINESRSSWPLSPTSSPPFWEDLATTSERPAIFHGSKSGRPGMPDHGSDGNLIFVNSSPD